MRRWATRDVASILELYHEDFVLVDHRAIGWETVRGLEAAEQLARSAAAIGPEIRMETDEIVACDERVMITLNAFRGPGVKAGELDYRFGTVQVVEDGRWLSGDLYDVDDEGAMVARYVELGGGLGPLGDSAPERVWAEHRRRFAARDAAGMLELAGDGWTMTDHRTLGWAPVRNREEAEQFTRSVEANTSRAMWSEVQEVVAVNDRALAMRMRWRGRGHPPVGEFEIPVGVVIAVENGVMTSYDQYEIDDTEAMLARFAEASVD